MSGHLEEKQVEKAIITKVRNFCYFGSHNLGRALLARKHFNKLLRIIHDIFSSKSQRLKTIKSLNPHFSKLEREAFLSGALQIYFNGEIQQAYYLPLGFITDPVKGVLSLVKQVCAADMFDWNGDV